MKKISVLVTMVLALTIFNGCQKDELVLIDEQPQAVVKPDVHVENGYLAFKNMETVDSIVSMLSVMNENEKEIWEKQIGLKSARAEFQKLYQEYDKLTSIDELVSFRDKYKSVLKFDGEEPSEWSVDYPFATRYFIPVLNHEGVYKVGQSLVKYTMTDQIVIVDGDYKKLKNLDKYSDDKMVKYMSKLKSSGTNSINLDEFEDDNLNPNLYERWSYSSSGTRRLRNQIIWDNYYYDDGSNINSGWKLLFFQKGEKKLLGFWKQYETVYGTQDIYVQVGSFPSYWINHYVAVYTPTVLNSTIECAADHQIGTTELFNYRPTVVFSAKTYSQGLGVWYTVDH